MEYRAAMDDRKLRTVSLALVSTGIVAPNIAPTAPLRDRVDFAELVDRVDAAPPADDSLIAEREIAAQAVLDRLTAKPVVAGWAGAAIDHADGSTLRIYVTTTEAERAIAALSLPKWVETVRVKRSLADLRALRDQLRAAARAEGERTIAQMSAERRRPAVAELQSSGVVTAIDVLSNRVRIEVGVGPAADLLRSLQRSGDVDPTAFTLVFRDRPMSATPHLDSCSPTADCIPLRAGVRLDPSAGGPCTSSFTLVDDQGARYTSTASHCSGSPWSHNGLWIGGTRWTQESTTVDTKIINIDNPSIWKATNTVWRPSGESFAITGGVGVDQSLVGSTVCNVGATKFRLGHGGGESCGSLTSIDGQAGSWKNLEWDQMGVGTYESCSGDSGGPVFNPYTHRAYGWNRGRTPATSDECGTGGTGGVETMFTWVGNGLAAANAGSLRRYSVLVSP